MPLAWHCMLQLSVAGSRELAAVFTQAPVHPAACGKTVPCLPDSLPRQWTASCTSSHTARHLLAAGPVCVRPDKHDSAVCLVGYPRTTSALQCSRAERCRAAVVLRDLPETRLCHVRARE